MRVIPVMDLLGGTVVRGVGGLRDQYRPIESQLADSSEPLPIARALREHLKTSYLYVADLDAIGTGTLTDGAFRQLIDDGFELLLDAGAFQTRQVDLLFGLGARDVIIGLETLIDPAVLQESVARYGDRVVFSLDLKANWPLTAHGSTWSALTPAQIVDEAVSLGVTRMIVLDLHSVGRGSGVATLDLCQAIRARYPHVRLITGGGVRSRDDLPALEAAGVEGVLVASALHDGRF